MTRSPLVQPLLCDRVDIIGDIHGEIDALHALLARLGCDVTRCTVERPLVFVGDLVDRGPDSVAVVMLVQRLVEAGVAQVVLGNHELNLLTGAQKEGNGWFLPNRTPADEWYDGKGRVPFDSREVSVDERARILAFVGTMPVALESPELRIVHAAWSPDALKVARQMPSLDRFVAPVTVGESQFDLAGAPTREALENPFVPVSFHHGLAAQLASEQNSQPVKVITSGPERPIAAGTQPTWLSGKWRLLERDPWWERDDEERSVIFGHYWRRRRDVTLDAKADALGALSPTAWFGRRGQAFCVDYSVGNRFKARHDGHNSLRDFGLAALRWPERVLVFDDEPAPVPTTHFAG